MGLGFLEQTAHRPWELPQKSWVVRQDWIDLGFLHWKVDLKELRKIVPEPLEIDLFEGAGFVGMVPFRMDKVRFKFTPPVPYFSSFPELNVRTYVRYNGRPGVFFLSLDAHSRLMVWQGRSTFQLPYYLAEMKHRPLDGGWHYHSRRTGDEDWGFEAKQYRQGEVFEAQPDTVAHFLAERYCLYVVEPQGKVVSVDIHHRPWPIYNGNIEITKNTMIQQFSGIDPLKPDFVHCSQGVECVGWWPNR